jgi:hypothetical protein
LLPGSLPGSVWYLDLEIFMAVRGRICRTRKYLQRANDFVYSGTSYFIGDVENGYTITKKPVDETCIVLGDSVIGNVGAEKSNERRAFSGN